MKKSFIVFVFFLIGLAPCSFGAEEGYTIINDEEISSAIQNWAKQIYSVSGLKHSTPKIYLIHEPSMNAFTISGGEIFVHTGLIAKCSHIGEFLAVLAHEIGHIEGGHVILRHNQADQLMGPSALLLVLGGVMSAISGSMDGLAAGMSGASDYFERRLSHFSVTQETAADKSALEYLYKLKWLQAIEGFASVFDKMNQQTRFAEKPLFGTIATHPKITDRIGQIRDFLKNHPVVQSKLTDADNNKFLLIKAKVIGFLYPREAIKAYNTNSIEGKYAHAIAYAQMGNTQKGLELTKGILATSPENPFFNELMGQILFESGRVSESIPYIKKAVQARKQSGHFRILLGHALIQRGQKNDAKEAVTHLKVATQLLPNNPSPFRLLSRAHGITGNLAEANLAIAKEAALTGDQSLARMKSNEAIRLSSDSKVKSDASHILSTIKEN